MPKANKEKDAFFYERIQSGFYVISPDGTVRNQFGNKLGSTTKRGAITIGARNPKGKLWYCFAHRLVWMYFHGPIPEGYYPIHDNRNPSDNSIGNLKLITEEEGQGYNRNFKFDRSKYRRPSVAKLTKDIVAEARLLHATGKVSVYSLSKKYGVSKQTMNSAITGETWKDVDAPPSTIVFRWVENKKKLLEEARVKYPTTTKTIHRLVDHKWHPDKIVQVLVDKGTKMHPDHIKGIIRQIKKAA